ncbi:hypothetical protein ACROYT_G028723 [Oculina patagonica]
MHFARAARAAMLITLISVTFKTSGGHTCWFSKKTRAGEECRGKIRRFNNDIARYVGTSTDAWACTRHWTRINREANSFCACPLSQHSKDLFSQRIPLRLLGMFDRIGLAIPGYRRGTRWCIKCYKTADSIFQNEVDFKPPNQRASSPSELQPTGALASIIAEQQTTEQLAKQLSETNQKAKLLEMELTKAKEQISSLSESTIEKLVPSFQAALYRQQQAHPDKKLYSSEEMEKFSDLHSPGLYQQILNSISNKKTSTKRRNLQQQRAVSLMHIIAYFRSQKTSSLQKDSGLHAASCGLSLRGLSAGQTLGYSTTPRNVQLIKANLNKAHANYIAEQLQRANELSCFIVLMVDDFHNIHTRHTPATLEATSVVHMASCLLDVHPSIYAVPRTNSVSLHREVLLDKDGRQTTCLGGIDKDAINEALQNALVYMQHQFLDQLPPHMKNLDPGKLQTALQELRVYSDPLQDDLETLETCMLIDEFEQDLKSMDNYKAALNHILNKYPGLEVYSKKFVVPLPADWPGWYYPKKLIASGWNPNINIVPEQGPFHFFPGQSEPNLWLVAGKTAEFLLDLFHDISQKCHNSQQTERTFTAGGRPKGRPTYFLPTFDTTVDTTCFPLSYNLDDVEPGLEPDPSTFCDYPTCSNSDVTSIKRLACFHCFHEACLPNGSCPICLIPLKKKAQKLADTFNTGLLKKPNEENDSEDLCSENDDEDTNTNITAMTPSEAETYYTSNEWSEKVDSVVNSYTAIPLPSKVNHSATNASRENTTGCATESSRRVHTLQPIIIPPTNDGNVTIWSFPANISQSTILGRMGSNACTFIALLFSKLFFSDNVDVPNRNLPLTQTWVYQVIVQGIILGNNVYDSISRNVPTTYAVSAASVLLKNIIGSVVLGPELPVSITQEANPAASLPFYWRSALNKGKTTSLFILGGNTVVFIPTPSGILLLDSHLHGNVGAVIAFAEWQNSFELLSWFKRINNFPFTLGTVTNVTFL